MTSDSRTLAGQVVLITGASRGIGAATAIEFARRGAAVALLGRSTDDSPSRLPGTLDAVVREIEAAGGRALALQADVRREDEVGASVERTLAEFGRIDDLVNNAAYFHAASFHETPLARWDLAIDVNLRGAVVCTQAVLPAMMAQRGGRIINISSGAAVDYYEGMSAYAASKAGLETLTRYLGAELAPHGIAANALRIDSAVATEGARFLNPGGDYSGWATAEEAALAVLWVAEQAVGFTGEVVLMSTVSGWLSADQGTD
jgi:NAD(P)-dependent dehydrogenase (short-subunit alcohol dehydrogenase family)